MPSQSSHLTSAAMRRIRRIGIVACLLAVSACSSISAPTDESTETADAATVSAPPVATATPAWLPGIAPSAGGTQSQDRSSGTALGSDADVADQGLWAPPSGASTAKRSPTVRGAIVAAVPSDTGDQATISRSSRRSASEETASAAPAPPADAEAFARRGDELLQTGDVVGARLCYERAVASGMAAAATRVGKTYDPLFLAAARVRGLQGDPAEAAAWYRKGINAGDPEALLRLSALSQMAVQ